MALSSPEKRDFFDIRKLAKWWKVDRVVHEVCCFLQPSFCYKKLRFIHTVWRTVINDSDEEFWRGLYFEVIPGTQLTTRMLGLCTGGRYDKVRKFSRLDFLRQDNEGRLLRSRDSIGHVLLVDLELRVLAWIQRVPFHWSLSHMIAFLPPHHSLRAACPNAENGILPQGVSGAATGVHLKADVGIDKHQWPIFDHGRPGWKADMVIVMCTPDEVVPLNLETFALPPEEDEDGEGDGAATRGGLQSSDSANDEGNQGPALFPQTTPTTTETVESSATSASKDPMSIFD